MMDQLADMMKTYFVPGLTIVSSPISYESSVGSLLTMLMEGVPGVARLRATALPLLCFGMVVRSNQSAWVID